MRKHDVRKWLHAILDLLPVILIPVFMIYSHRHEINDGSIQVQEKQVVDFNQLINDWDTRYTSGLSFDDGYLSINGSWENTSYSWSNSFDLVENHIYIARGYVNSSWDGLTFYLDINGSNTLIGSNYRFTAPTFQVTKFNIRILGGSSFSNILFAPQIYDLTQMFGFGNEPTINDFNQFFPLDYYAFTLSHKELIDGDLVTFNDTDIMSQMTYQLYNSVDKYFNMGNVFNLGGLYDWFNLNIFNGQAPIYIFIVWQIALYEFVMDLLFLLYGLFMWFIDIVENIMNKPFKSIK